MDHNGTPGKNCRVGGRQEQTPVIWRKIAGIQGGFDKSGLGTDLLPGENGICICKHTFRQFADEKIC